jgi:hypothetical protein
VTVYQIVTPSEGRCSSQAPGSGSSFGTDQRELALLVKEMEDHPLDFLAQRPWECLDLVPGRSREAYEAIAHSAMPHASAGMGGRMRRQKFR